MLISKTSWGDGELGDRLAIADAAARPEDAASNEALDLRRARLEAIADVAARPADAASDEALDLRLARLDADIAVEDGALPSAPAGPARPGAARNGSARPGLGSV